MYSRIQAACWIATKIGVKSFYQPQIAASCSAFIEMLGGNSILLRLLVDVGNKVVTHKNAKLMSWGGGIQWRKDYCKQHEEETGKKCLCTYTHSHTCVTRHYLVLFREVIEYQLTSTTALHFPEK